MANGYPHMVFVQPDPGLDKEALSALLTELFPDGQVEDKPLRLDLELDGYTFSFWFEEAEGVADRYATYLPEGARRRWLSRCEEMIDFHGQADADGSRAAQAQIIVEALVARDGVEVFSEDTRRFIGMDYGDGMPEAAPAADQAEIVEATEHAAVASPSQASAGAPEPAPLPAEVHTEVAEIVQAAVDAPARMPEPSPTPGLAPTPPIPPASPEPVVVQPEPVAVPPVPQPAPEAHPTQAPTYVQAATHAPAVTEQPAPVEQPQPEPEKKGLFKRLFGRG